ncbi:pectate lyase family protein [Kibdelosporangium aridum]|uniref:pectate lyase family protein n=1 Tax=Kibdelosporangium aridum TaxID=2030 RepID=UPI0035E9D48D
MIRLAALVGFALAASIALPPAASAATLLSDDFEDGNTTGWSTSSGSWSVVADGSRALRQSGTSSDARALLGLSWSDQSVQVRVKPTGFGATNRHVAVAARAQNASSYYYLALTANSSVVLGKRSGSGFTTLASAPAAVSTGSWYTLRLEAFGTTLRGFVDGTLLTSAVDTSFASGRVGVTTNYASASFDDVLVTDVRGPGGPPDPPPPGTCDTSGTATGFASVDAWGQNGTTGGAGGPTVEVDTATEFLTAIGRTGPVNICVRGMIALPGPMHDVTSDKTIVGVGSASGFTGGGLNIGLPVADGVTTPPPDAVHNVIVRNLVFRNWADDAINVQMFSHHVWIDHNDLASGKDGAIDIKRGSSYVTVSWNHTHNHTKNMLLGHDDSNGAQDTGLLKVTYHHNWFNETPQRNPRVRFGEPVHIYNNYYLHNTDVGVACQASAGCVVEGNYFENVEEPVSNHYAGPTGRCVARDNVFAGESGEPDCSGTVQEPRAYYSYTLDDPNSVKASVMAGAGVGKIGATALANSVDGFASVNALGQNGTTGGAGGPTVTVTTAAQLRDYAGRAGPFVIMLSGRIQFDGMITVVANKSIIGTAGAEISGGGLQLGSTTRPGNNVIIRNIKFGDASDDSISVTNSAHHVWIDHNEFLPGADGSVDVKRQSNYVTVSWNRFRGTDKSMLLGHSDNYTADVGYLKVTYHHNFFDGSAQRHPRVRFGEPVHVYNNYYRGNSLYGVASTMDAGVLVEGNYFENVPFPCHVGYAESDPGRIMQRGNAFSGSGTCEAAGSVVEPRTYYQYTLDSAANVPAIVRDGAGTGRI